MRVLIACEFSGVIRQAFRLRGHDAWSCDVRPSADNSAFHFQSDCSHYLFDYWDLLIAHPPCTHLALSGARWIIDHWVKRKNKPPRWHDGSKKREQQKKALEFFRMLLNCNIPKRCIENPMSVASSLVAPKDQTIHPWQFGHIERKTTWLWLRGLPQLKPTRIVYEQMIKLPYREQAKVYHMGKSLEREMLRSITFQGIANAMADQWG